MRYNSNKNAVPPKVSIIIPMHNVEAYVSQAIESVLSQSFDNFELIIVDDGSTDSSFLIAANFVEKDCRCRILRQGNRGPGASRNLGIDSAKGEYLYFLDADDILMPNALQICIDLFIKLNLDFIAFSSEVFTSIPGWKDRFPHYIKPDILDPVSGCDLLAKLYKIGSYSASPCLYICSLSLIKTNSLKFDEGVLHEDEGFTPLLYYEARRTVSLSNALFRRRIREGSIMTTQISYRNSEGWIQAAYKIFRYSISIKFKHGYHCTRPLFALQRRLLRTARRTAENIDRRNAFISDLKKKFGLKNLIFIDIGMAFYVYANQAFLILRSVKKMLKRCINRPHSADRGGING